MRSSSLTPNTSSAGAQLSLFPTTALEWLKPDRRHEPSSDLDPTHAGSAVVFRDAVPTLPSGKLDVAAMAAAGMTSDLAEANRRRAALDDLAAELRGAVSGQKRATYVRVATRHGISRTTLYRWARSLRTKGEAALAPGWGRKPGNGSRAMSDGMRHAVLAAYGTQQAISFKQAHAVAERYAVLRGETCPHPATVRRFLQEQVSPLEEAAFRHGRKRFEQDILARCVRDLSSIEPHDVWCGDCRKLDVMVLAPDGAVVRPWLAAWCDVKTAGIVGYVVRCGSINTRGVALSLRAAILAHGAPDSVLVDNGKEYVNHYWHAPRRWLDNPPGDALGKVDRFPMVLPPCDAHEADTLLSQLGIRPIIARPFSPQSKPIESHFNALFGEWENLVPGYCGRDAKQRPEVLKRHRKEGLLLDWPQFCDLLAQRVRWWNEEHICGERECPPAEAWAQAPARTIPDACLLDVLLEKVERRAIRPHGIRLDPEHIFNSPDLALHVGRTCQVRYDPDDMRAVTVFVRDGTALLRLAVPLAPKARWNAPYTVGIEAANAARRAQKRRLREIHHRNVKHARPEYVDPTGGFRMVAARKQEEADAAQLVSAKATALAAEIKTERNEAAQVAERKHEEQNAALNSRLDACGADWLRLHGLPA